MDVQTVSTAAAPAQAPVWDDRIDHSQGFTTNAYGPAIAVSPDGMRVVIIFSGDHPGGGLETYVAVSTDGGKTYRASRFIGIPNGSVAGTSGPVVAIGADGWIHVGQQDYVGDRHGWYNRSSDGITWEGWREVVPYNINGLSITAGAGGAVAMVYDRITTNGNVKTATVECLHSSDSGQHWDQTAEVLNPGGIGLYGDATGVVAISGGDLVAAYSLGPTGAYNLYGQVRHAGAWGGAEPIWTGRAYHPRLTSFQGEAQVVFQVNVGAAINTMRARYLNGAWSAPEQLNQTGVNTTFPACAYTPTGKPFAFWVQAVGTVADGAEPLAGSLLYYTYQGPAGWVTPAKVEVDAAARCSVPIAAGSALGVNAAYMYDPSGQPWKVVSRLMVIDNQPPPTPGQTFVDVGPNNYFFAAVEDLHTKGLVHGHQEPDGLHFFPHDPIARDEFAGIMSAAIAWVMAHRLGRTSYLNTHN